MRSLKLQVQLLSWTVAESTYKANMTNIEATSLQMVVDVIFYLYRFYGGRINIETHVKFGVYA